MKSIVLGLMVASVSMSFAQNDGQTHQLKKRFSAKQMMTVEPAAADVRDNAETNQNSEFVVLSRKEVKSDVVSGVIRVKNGTPFIDIMSEDNVRRMMPVNFPKSMAIDGQEIQFRYTVSDKPLPKNGKCSMTINVFDIAMSPRK